jgi:hypothetical protein
MSRALSNSLKAVYRRSLRRPFPAVNFISPTPVEPPKAKEFLPNDGQTETNRIASCLG